MKIGIGDTVRLTGAFLRNTGQIAGGEGTKRWTVRALENGERWAVTDEMHSPTFMLNHYPDIPVDSPDHESLRYRRIAICNLEKVKPKTV